MAPNAILNNRIVITAVGSSYSPSCERFEMRCRRMTETRIAEVGSRPKRAWHIWRIWCRFRAVWKKKSTFKAQTSRKMWGLISRRAPTSISMGSFPSRGSASYRLIHRIQVSNNLRMSEPSRNGASIFLRAPRQTRKPCAKVRNKSRNSENYVSGDCEGMSGTHLIKHCPDRLQHTQLMRQAEPSRP